MSARFSLMLLLFAACIAALVGGCDRELRKLSKPRSLGPLAIALIFFSQSDV